MDTDRVQCWTVVLQPGDALDYAHATWVDTLLVVRRGELEVECRSGRRASFPAGAVLTLAGLPVRKLRNTSANPLVLQGMTRRNRTDD